MRKHFTCSHCGADFERQASQVRVASVCCSLSCAASIRRKTGGFEIMEDGVTAMLPLHGQKGAMIRHALIDAADAESLGQYRWYFNNGYVARDKNGLRVALHREVLGLRRGDGLDADHRNRNRLDNRRANLRIVTRAQNGQNLPSQAGSSSSYRGVTWDRAHLKWRSKIMVNRKSIYLGLFDDEAEAGRVAREARSRLMPYAVD